LYCHRRYRGIVIFRWLVSVRPLNLFYHFRYNKPIGASPGRDYVVLKWMVPYNTTDNLVLYFPGSIMPIHLHHLIRSFNHIGNHSFHFPMVTLHGGALEVRSDKAFQR